MSESEAMVPVVDNNVIDVDDCHEVAPLRRSARIRAQVHFLKISTFVSICFIVTIVFIFGFDILHELFF